MPLNNFGSGFREAIVIRGLPLSVTHPGKIFWVSNATQAKYQSGNVEGSNGNVGSFTAPFATLTFALSQCQHGRGDIVMIKPGHREDIPDATSLVVSANGVAVIGLGTGAMRPTFTFTTATSATVTLRSANNTFYNLLFIANFAAITTFVTPNRGVSATCTIADAVNPAGFGILTTVGAVTGGFYPGAIVNGTGVAKGTYILSQLSGTANGIGTYLVYPTQTVSSFTATSTPSELQIVNCEFRDAASNLNAIAILSYNANPGVADGLYFANNKIISLGTTAATTALKIPCNSDRVTINDNVGTWAVLNDTAAMLAVGANSIINFEFARNSINRPNTSTTVGLAISTSGTAWTGQCTDNRIWGLNNSAQIWIDTGTKLAFNQNYCPITAAADKSGLINPAAV